MMALPTPLPLRNLLNLHLHLLEMLPLLGRRPRPSPIFLSSFLPELHASELIRVIVHYHKIFEFEVHEGDVCDKCVTFDEVSEDQLYVMEGVVLL